MTKVLMVGNDSTVKGGITSVITQLMSHDWYSEGIDMRFIPTYVDSNSVNKILFFAKAYKEIQREIHTNKPDVVHIHMSYKGSFIRKYLIHNLCKRNEIPDIIHLHGSEFKKWYDETSGFMKMKIKQLLLEAKAFVVLGDKWEQAIKEIEQKTKTVVVSNTVAVPQESVNWNEPFSILFLGVLIKRKGVSDLLKATKIMKEKLTINEFNVIIAGIGPEENNLKKEAKDLNIESIVDFVGWTDGEMKKKLLKKCQMLVLPSYNEGLPIAILEAMSYAMPIVASNVGDISSAVIDGVNGSLIESGNVEMLANELCKIIENKSLYERYSINSKKICNEYFSDEKYFNIFNDLYNSL